VHPVPVHIIRYPRLAALRVCRTPAATAHQSGAALDDGGGDYGRHGAGIAAPELPMRLPGQWQRGRPLLSGSVPTANRIRAPFRIRF
jgi:hypothetical protein